MAQNATTSRSQADAGRDRERKKSPIMMRVPEVPAAGGDSHDALRLMVSAWEEGTDAGISPEVMAFAALYTGLADLIAALGEDRVARLMERLAARVRDGEFSFYATRQ